MAAQPPIRVLLIAGAGRSGSTLLELMLDQVPGLTAVGELTDLWDAGLIRGERCGCGQRFHECPFWSEVGKRAFGGWENVDAAQMLELHDAVARNRQLPRLLAAPMLPSFRASLERYAEALSRVYSAIAAVSTPRLIVDASKWPSHAMVLRTIRGLDLRMAHLVRDPRAVSYSWARELERPHAIDSASLIDKSAMRRDPPVVSAIHWSVLNLGVEIVGRLGVAKRLVLYDDLVSAPGQTLAGILSFAIGTATADDLAFVRERTVRLAAGHGIAGNPSRFRSGDVKLQASNEWRRQLSLPARWSVNAVTFPGQALYLARGPVTKQ